MKRNYLKLKIRKDKTPYFVEEDRTYSIDTRTVFNTPEKIYKFCSANEICDLAEEYVYAMYLTNNLKLIAFCEISHGSIKTSLFPQREIIQRALLLGAVQIILIHNHPSGETKPSRSDIINTQKMSNACDICGLILAEHLIVTETDYTSLKSEGIL